MSPEDMRNPPWVTAYLIIVGGVTIALVLWFGSPSQSRYTLYRTNASDDAQRIHVASFDDTHDAVHNHENCNAAASQLVQRPGSIDRFWCEAGKYQP